jgi:nitrogenase iron protein NifH
MRQIAIYGKGGIGKSTTACNLSAALADSGKRGMQVGCDPKQDSTTTLAGRFLPSLLDTLQDNKISFDAGAGQSQVSPTLIEKFIVKGFNDVLCIEAGGPKPGVGCAGRGVLVALEYIQRNNLYERYGIDFVVYDVLGDVVCGGFAAPMRKGFASEVYLLTSAELMALYAANNIATTIQRLANERMNVRVGGIIHNQRNVLGEVNMLEEFADRLGVPIMAHIPRSADVQKAELHGKTVVEALPDSHQTNVYRRLAEQIVNNTNRYVPRPYESLAELQGLLRNHQLSSPCDIEARWPL